MRTDRILSICIPTFNRAKSLDAALNAIQTAIFGLEEFVEICVSNNHSDDETNSIIKKYITLPIKYYEQTQNVGRVKNYIDVISMASGEYVWLIGDDDILLPKSLEQILKVIESSNAEFISINCYVANSYNDIIKKEVDLLQPFSSSRKRGVCEFSSLINPLYKFDFLGAMYMAVFKRSGWLNFVNKIESQIIDDEEFSSFDNTFPHVIVFVNAFFKSRCYISNECYLVSLNGYREWVGLYPLVRSIRLIESLVLYRRHGLSHVRYFLCKNYALSNYFEDVYHMHKNKEKSGYLFVDWPSQAFQVMLYPGFYYSLVKFVLKILKKLLWEKNETNN